MTREPAEPARPGPVIFDLDDETEISPSTAPAVPDAQPGGATALQHVAVVAARRGSPLVRWFWGLLLALTGFMLSLAAWDYVTGLLARSPVLGAIASVLGGLLCLVLLIIAWREFSSFRRLKRLDTIQIAALAARNAADLPAARRVLVQIETLYAAREDTAWGRKHLRERQADIFDADGLLGLAETSLLAPLDQRALREVEGAARQVALVTAIVPLALADVFAALTSNLRMIRRIAEIYGGRSGVLGSWRLVRAVLSHLVATGAVAVGDDLIGTVAGGGVLTKVSRRFGEGVINGALTARVGVAAMEVCRPLPFHAVPRPSVTASVRRALTGLFGGAR